MTETKKTTAKRATIKLDKTPKAIKKATATAKKEVKKETKKVVEKTTEKVAVKKAPVVAKVKKAKPSTGNATYATGKRKNAIAKVWMTKGTGKITINGKPASEYLKRAILEVIINQPFGKTETENKFDINCSVLGGGLSGQAGAIKHAISIALQLLNPDLRDSLKKAGFLTRDSRVVERKKAGLKKARKGQVYQRR